MKKLKKNEKNDKIFNELFNLTDLVNLNKLINYIFLYLEKRWILRCK